MKTIAEFNADIAQAVGRAGVSASVPGWASQAINLLENQRTFIWQRRIVEFPLVPAVDSNRIDLTDYNIKAFNWAKFGVRQGAGSGQVTLFGREITIVDPRQIVSIDVGYGGAAYLDGVETLVLDALPQEASTLFASVWLFTDWAEDFEDADTPPVLARHYFAFKALTMKMAAADLRDDRLIQIWGGMSDVGLAAAWVADEDAEWRARNRMEIGMNNRGA